MSTETTKKRIYSAIALSVTAIIIMALGQEPAKVALYFIGLLICDEIQVNFLKTPRDSKAYLYFQGLYLLLVAISYFLTNTYFPEFLIFLNLILCAVELVFLFEWKNYSLSLTDALKKWRYSVSILIFLPIHSIVRMIDYPNWLSHLVGLLLLVIFADTGAWFFGRRFGKTPLMESVSPNKTREGFIGGLLCSIIGSYIYSHYSFGLSGSYPIIAFTLLVLASVAGDLVQSKLKRRFELKDSSSLIPGHGGLYDRTDSLLFTAPFYFLLIV